MLVSTMLMGVAHVAGDVSDIIRGAWFYDCTWQPLEDRYAILIEEDHITHFLGQRLESECTQTTKGHKPGKDFCLLLYLAMLHFLVLCRQSGTTHNLLSFSQEISAILHSKLHIMLYTNLCSDSQYQVP